MTIFETLRQDLKVAMKEKTSNLTDIKYILAEFSRLKGTKDGKTIIGDVLTDEQVIRVLNNIIAGENKVLELVPNSTSTLKPLCESYLPQKATEEEVIAFLDTVDFSTLRNKMQAVGLAKKYFGTAADGAMIGEIVKNWEI